MIQQLRNRLKRYEIAPLKDGQVRGQAAVLIPILNGENPSLILTERASHLGTHAGEVAWPGGKADPEDASLLHTALRESQEEINLDPGRVEVIAELRPFISKHGLLVTPYVGLVDDNVELAINEQELSAIFYVPLDYLLDDPRTESYIIQRHGERHVVPVYHYDGFRIWGLTAMILQELMIHGLGIKQRD